MSSRQLEEQQERRFNAWVAEELGLSLDELEGLDWSIDESDGNDGAVYGHIITFDDGSDPDILAKIDGLQDGRWVQIGFPPGEEGSE